MRASDLSKNAKTIGAEECREFLLAVVNAADRAESRGVPRRFRKLYREWFPKDMTGNGAADALKVILYSYTVPQMWKAPRSRIEEKPTTEFQLNVAILRDRLRSLWGEPSDYRAKLELTRLKEELLDYRRGGNAVASADVVDWRVRTMTALDWFEDNFRRLRVCMNPHCVGTTYFVRQNNNQRYCCVSCWEEVDKLKRIEKARQHEPKRILSEKARQSISKAQKRRWRQYRSRAASEHDELQRQRNRRNRD